MGLGDVLCNSLLFSPGSSMKSVDGDEAPDWPDCVKEANGRSL